MAAENQRFSLVSHPDLPRHGVIRALNSPVLCYLAKGEREPQTISQLSKNNDPWSWSCIRECLMDEGGQGRKNMDGLMFGRYRKCRVPMKKCLKNQGVDVERAAQEILSTKTPVLSTEPKPKSESRKMLWICPHLEIVGIAFF